jgi:ribosomal protein S18 acetylase RimI-like enzyme
MNVSSEFTIRPLVASDHAWVSPFMAEHWGADIIVVHNQIFIPSMLPGFVAERRGVQIGLVTYSLYAHDCEIVTMDSLMEKIGVGSALVESVETAARQGGATRLWLVTTNDNLSALGFYQRRGFRMARIHSNAVEHARTFKPNIPQVGENLIPIVDEIELEKQL